MAYPMGLEVKFLGRALLDNQALCMLAAKALVSLHRSDSFSKPQLPVSVKVPKFHVLVHIIVELNEAC